MKNSLTGLDKRDQLIIENMRFVAVVAKAFGYRSGLDLFEIGLAELPKAIDSYDPDRGTKLSTHVIWRARSVMQHALRGEGRLIAIPSWIQELNSYIQKAIDKDIALGRKPDFAAIANQLETTEEIVLMVMAAMEINQSLDSIDQLLPSQDSYPTSIRDNIRDEKSNIVDFLDSTGFEDLIKSLQPHCRKIFEMNHFDGLSQAAIARVICYSQNHMSRILKSILKCLRRKIIKMQIGEEAPNLCRSCLCDKKVKQAVLKLLED